MINRCTPNPEFHWPDGTFWCFRQPIGFAERISLETSEAKQYEPAFAPCKPGRFLLGSGRLVSTVHACSQNRPGDSHCDRRLRHSRNLERGLVVLRLRRFLACASLFLTFFCASPAELDAETPRAEEPKGVLLLYLDEMSLPGERAADDGIRSVLGNKPDIRIYSEHLDTSLFPDPKFQAAQLAWLRNKYRDRRIDLVIAVGLPSQNLLPDIPTVFCGMERNGLSHATLPPNATAVWLSPDFEGTLTAAARLQPGAHQVVVLSGTTPWDRHVEMGLRNTPQPPGTHWDISYWDNISVEEMRLRLAALPKDTIVLYLSIVRDGAGHP